MKPLDVSGADKRARKSRLSRWEKRELMAEKFSAKRLVYENCRMLSKEGELLCYCDLRKVQWYEVIISHSSIVRQSECTFESNCCSLSSSCNLHTLVHVVT